MSAERTEAAGAYYASRLGFALAPLPAGEKGPRRDGWNRAENAVTTDADVWGAVREGDAAGWGVIHGMSGTAALDADQDAERVAEALAAVGVDYRAILDAYAPKIVGNPENPPKPLFRVPEGLTLSRRALSWPMESDGEAVLFELRAGPVQDVLPPHIHPDTGEPYAWTTPPRTRDDLPFVPADLLGAWLAWDELRGRMRAACPWSNANAGRERRAARSALKDTAAEERPGSGVIDEFNRRVDAATILERHNYEPVGRGRWIAPDSTTGRAGVVELEGGMVFSHHASDPLSGQHTRDAFDCYRILDHGGDTKAAVRAAAEELGMDEGRGRRTVSVAVAGGAR